VKPHIQFLKRPDGVRLAYSVFGDGPPLVIVSPWITNLALSFEDHFFMNFWREVSRSFTLVFYDKHGCGQSDRDRKIFDVDSEILDLQAVIDHLQLDKVILFGESMAGATSLTYAVQNQQKVSHLLLYSVYADGKKLAKEPVRDAIISLVKASWGIGSKALADLFYPEAPSDWVNAFTRYQKESTSAEVATGIIELIYALDVTELLPRVDIPTLVLHRKEDAAINFAHGKDLAASIPGARLKALGGKIHFPYYEEPGVIIKEILSFLGVDGIVDRNDSHENAKPAEVEQLTIAFTDIVSSTKLISKHGDAESRDIFLKHDKIVRKQISRYGGRELQNLGDGFMLAFPSASSCIKCSCAIVKDIASKLPMIEIKVGINTGEVVIREGRHPFGQAVVIASRIVDRCQGSQILVSELSRQLVAGSKFSFSQCGEFIPKGFEENLKVYEVKCDD